jgi:hypothetical protein
LLPPSVAQERFCLFLPLASASSSSPASCLSHPSLRPQGKYLTSAWLVHSWHWLPGSLLSHRPIGLRKPVHPTPPLACLGSLLLSLNPKPSRALQCQGSLSCPLPFPLWCLGANTSCRHFPLFPSSTSSLPLPQEDFLPPPHHFIFIYILQCVDTAQANQCKYNANKMQRDSHTGWPLPGRGLHI